MASPSISVRSRRARPAVLTHGSQRLPAVVVDCYNSELRDDDGNFLGDQATRRAFAEILERWREPLRKLAADPFGKQESEGVAKRDLENVLVDGDPEAAAVVHGAIEEFAQHFAGVIRRLLRVKGWRQTERIVVGGGFRRGRIGERVIGRTSVILKEGGVAVELVPMHDDPDCAGLIGALHLVPPWMFKGCDAIVAVDIGGANLRAGLVALNAKKAANLSKAEVEKVEHWRHDGEVSRTEMTDRLLAIVKGLVDRATHKNIDLAPFVGIGCPGKIQADGSITRGTQNLPGNWGSAHFNLPDLVREAVPTIGDEETVVVMHNDAVVQGLSAVPYMRDAKGWAVLTIGTGLGNAHFTNREEPAKRRSERRTS